MAGLPVLSTSSWAVRVNDTIAERGATLHRQKDHHVSLVFG